MDKIKIQNLEVFGRHGVFQEENTLGQKFLVNCVLYIDARKAGKSDELADSIHYGEICHYITEYMRDHTFKLIESAAEHLAQALLLHTPHLEKLDLEIKKPWAPIGLPIETVAVEITRGWHDVCLSIGSNMGDKKAHLDFGVSQLEKETQVKDVKVSSYIETEPYGVTEQAVFLNACLRMKTLMTPKELLEKLHEIEKAQGRERIRRWGPRTLDMDILFYDDLIYESEDLIIPHIDMHNREFVLRPLAQLCPGKVHPVTGKTVLEMLKEKGDWKLT